MFLMDLDRMLVQESFTVIVAYIPGAVDPVGEPLDVQPTLFQENYGLESPSRRRLFSPHRQD